MQVHTHAHRAQNKHSQRIVLKLLQFLLFLFDDVYEMAFTMVLFILRCIESKYSDKYSNME